MRIASQLKSGSLTGHLREHYTYGDFGFSLVELLVVMTIIGILVALALPSLQKILDAGDFSHAINDITLTLSQGRTYAMANNTYVFVGFEEVDETQNPTAQAQVSGIGRVAMAAVASLDGTSGYDPNNMTSPTAWTNYSGGSDLKLIRPIEHFNNLHLCDYSGVAGSGNMSRPAVGANYQVGNSTFLSLTPFTFPLGPNLPPATGYQYYFTKVIQFDSQGTATIQSSASAGSITPWIELGLQPVHGNNGGVSPAAPQGNQAAIQIEGTTGAIHIYRP